MTWKHGGLKHLNVQKVSTKISRIIQNKKHIHIGSHLRHIKISEDFNRNGERINK